MVHKRPHWDDLAPEIRHRIQEARAAELRDAGPPIPGQKRWQCSSCGDVLKSWAAAERHASHVGHRRIELILDAGDTAE